MVTLTSHIFTDILQREHFLAINFLVSNEKNMGYLLIPKSQKAWEKVEKIGLGSFNIHIWPAVVLKIRISWDFASLFSLVQTGSLNSILAKSDHKNLIR